MPLAEVAKLIESALQRIESDESRNPANPRTGRRPVESARCWGSSRSTRVHVSYNRDVTRVRVDGDAARRYLWYLQSGYVATHFVSERAWQARSEPFDAAGGFAQ